MKYLILLICLIPMLCFGQTHGVDYIMHYGAEMYFYENTDATTIEAVAQWHPIFGLTAGENNGFAFDAGSTIDILSFDDYSGTVVGTIKATTDGAHGFATGDPIGLVGSDIEAGDANAYAGVYIITIIDADEFYFTSAAWNATSTGVAILPARFTANAGAGGNYSYNSSMSLLSAANSKTVDSKLFINATEQIKSESRFDSKLANLYQALPGSACLTIAADDKIWFGVKGVTDNTNITIRYANLKIHD